MRYRTYRYNTLTCQYERVKVNAKNVIWYGLGLAVTGMCLLVGILLLHDLVVNTENEKRLRKENRAFKQHHAILSSQLNELHPVLAILQNKDRVLHSRFFGSQPLAPAQDVDRASKQKLLLADPDSFRAQVTLIKTASQKLIDRSSGTNHYFGDKVSLSADDADDIFSLPTLQPITPWDTEKLISGFGLRVNPFHKGLYQHLGVDIATPRGTPVIATAAGQITQLKRSDLQAGYGNYVEVSHGHGVETRYAHLENIEVKFGEKIKKGQVIGTVGTSGGSIAPHLHYEILLRGNNIDPVIYMVEGLTSDQHHHLTLVSHQQNQSLD